MKHGFGAILSLFFLIAAGAPARAQDVVGSWSCQHTTQSLTGPAAHAMEFRMTLTPEGHFWANGSSAVVGESVSGSGSFQFRAEGDWTLAESAAGRFLSLHGGMTGRPGAAEGFVFGAMVYPDGTMFWQDRTEAEAIYAICRR